MSFIRLLCHYMRIDRIDSLAAQEIILDHSACVLGRMNLDRFYHFAVTGADASDLMAAVVE